MHAALVADEIRGYMLQPARRGARVLAAAAAVVGCDIYTSISPRRSSRARFYTEAEAGIGRYQGGRLYRP